MRRRGADPRTRHVIGRAATWLAPVLRTTEQTSRRSKGGLSGLEVLLHFGPEAARRADPEQYPLHDAVDEDDLNR